MLFKHWLNEATKEEFMSVATLQRNKPEKAMLAFQRLMGGGIMNSAAENIGDLTHRMSEKNTFITAGYEFVKEKVDKCLMWLTNGYGFEREFEENIKNNARYLNLDEDEYRQKIYQALLTYSNEHLKLPTDNRAQGLAKLAAVSLGRREFKTTVHCLTILDAHLLSRDKWVKFAHEGVQE